MYNSIDTIDFRLIDIDLALSDLNYHIDFLETHIKNVQAYERLKLNKLIDKRGLIPDDSDWQEVLEIEYFIDFFLPRIFRAPFIVSVYAVYESAVTEIAALIQKQKGIVISINDLRGDFLDRAKKYFKDVIEFQIYSDKSAWQRINMLFGLRHAIAHANGRIEMLNRSLKQKVSNLEKQKVGISSERGFIVIEESFLRETYRLVSESLSDLVERYRQWDDHQRAQG
jgi:hypothetical protein